MLAQRETRLGIDEVRDLEMTKDPEGKPSTHIGGSTRALEGMGEERRREGLRSTAQAEAGTMPISDDEARKECAS